MVCRDGCLYKVMAWRPEEAGPGMLMAWRPEKAGPGMLMVWRQEEAGPRMLMVWRKEEAFTQATGRMELLFSEARKILEGRAMNTGAWF